MAPTINLSGPARKVLVGNLLSSLMQLQNDGGLSTLARFGTSLLVSWLTSEHARLSQRYPSTNTLPKE